MAQSGRMACIAGAIGLLAFASPGHAQKTFTVGGYGGAFEQSIRKDVVPAFEKKTGVKIEYVAGSSNATLARLQSDKEDQKLDIVILDDGPMHKAIRQGFCTPILGLPINDLYEPARFKDNRAVGIGLAATGLVYNPRYFREKNWPAPSSWNDLGDPRYRKLLVVPPIGNTYGLQMLVMMARLNGGSENNIEPGFSAMKAKVNPNVLAYDATPGKIAEMFQTGRAVLGVWGSGRVQAMIDAGLPVDFVYPKEGAVALLAAACPVAKSVVSPFASDFIRTLVGTDFQLVLAREYGYGPVNRKAAVHPADLRVAPQGDRAAKLLALDWDVINEHREEWARRWIGEIER